MAFFNFVRPSRSKSNVWNKQKQYFKTCRYKKMRFKLNVSLATVNRLRCCEQRFALNFYILTMCQHQYKYLSTIAPRAIQLFGSTSNICRPSRRLINGPLELYNRSRTKIKLATNSWCTLIPFFFIKFYLTL